MKTATFLLAALGCSFAAADDCYRWKRYDQSGKVAMSWRDYAASLVEPTEFSCGNLWIPTLSTSLVVDFHISNTGMTAILISSPNEAEFMAMVERIELLGDMNYAAIGGQKYCLLFLPPQPEDKRPFDNEMLLRWVLGPLNMTYRIEGGVYYLAFKGQVPDRLRPKTQPYRRRYIVIKPLSGLMKPNSS